MQTTERTKQAVKLLILNSQKIGSNCFDHRLIIRKVKRAQRIEYTVKDKLQEKALEDVVFGDFKDLEHFGSERVLDKEEIEPINGIS